MADIRFGVAQAPSPTSPGLCNFTDNTGLSGATGKGALFFGANAVTAGTERVSYTLCIGATDGTNHFACSWGAGDGASTKNRRAATTVPVQHYTNAGTAFLVGAFSALIANGVQLNYTTTDATARLMNAWLFGGADLKIRVGTVILNTTQNGTATLDLNWGGGEPDALIVIGTGDPFDDTNHSTVPSGACMSVGLVHKAAGVITQEAVAEYDHATGIANAGARRLTSRCYGLVVNSGTTNIIYQSGAEVTDITDEVITFTTRDGVGQGSLGVVALYFGGHESSLFEFDTPTVTGNATKIVGLRPKAVLLVPNFNTAIGSNEVATCSFGISALVAHAEVCQAGWTEDNVSPHNVNNMADTKAANIRPHTASTTGDAIATGPVGGAGGAFTDDSLTLNFSEAPASVLKWFGLAVTSTNVIGLQLSEGAETSTSATGVLVTAYLT